MESGARIPPARRGRFPLAALEGLKTERRGTAIAAARIGQAFGQATNRPGWLGLPVRGPRDAVHAHRTGQGWMARGQKSRPNARRPCHSG